MKRLFLLIVILVGGLCATSVRILDERTVAFRTLLGDPDPAWFPWMESRLVGPTLYLDLPLLHSVERFDQRVQRFESPPRELYLEQDNIAIGYFVIWRIENVRRLLENAQPGDVQQLIDDKTYNAVRNELATRSLRDLLSDAREELSEKIREQSDQELDKIGIEVLGVTIRQVEFLAVTLQRVFDRMKQDRERLAKRLRAEGEEQARQIRAEADRDSTVEVARARSEAARLRGEGEARAAGIYAKSFDRDREFYQFVRSLEAYRKSLDEKTTLVLSPDDPFLRYLFEAGVPPASVGKPAAPGASAPSGPAGGPAGGRAGSPTGGQPSSSGERSEVGRSEVPGRSGFEAEATPSTP